MLKTIVALSLGALGAYPAVAAPPAAQTDGGQVAGIIQDGTDVFLGLPFAAPPVGPLRWRAPQAAAAWTGVLTADRYRDDCVQPPIPGGGKWSAAPAMSEDCLYLNVWRPSGTKPTAKWPVMVWIHGGGFSSGSGAWPLYNGANIARRNVVLVSINYRLGRFGFFAHPALMDQAKTEPVANYGLMDQIAALKWVKRNIAAFGGDPKNVTIFGESAGGMSVNMLMASPAGRGLFAKAISQSGGGGKMATIGMIDKPSLGLMGKQPSALDSGQAFSVALGLANPTADQLRAIPADEVLGLARGGTRYGNPVVDGQLLTEEVSTTFRAGRQAKVPYMVGANSFEASLIGTAGVDAMFAGLKAPQDKVDALYTGYGTRDPKWMRAELVGDVIMGAGARAMARAQASSGAPVYAYRFDYVVDSIRAQSPGTSHGGEIGYIFGTYKQMPYPPMATDASFSSEVLNYWTQFAKTGNPNGMGAPEWPRFSPANEQVQLLTNNGIKSEHDYLKDRFDFVDSLGS